MGGGSSAGPGWTLQEWPASQKGLDPNGPLFRPVSGPSFVSVTMDIKGLVGPFMPNLASLCH